MSDIQPYITAFYRTSRGFTPDPAYTDFITAFTGDPTLVQAARDGLVSVRQIIASRGGDQCQDHELNAKQLALSQMLNQFDSRGG